MPEGNPYGKQPTNETYVAQVTRMEKGIAWIEGDIHGYKRGRSESDEVVAQLLQACELARKFLENVVAVSTEFIPGEGALDSVLRDAITKAAHA